MPQFNLAFYCFPKKEAIEDFRAAATLIEARAKDIKVSVLSTASVLTTLRTPMIAIRPSLSIELDRLKLLRPLRGTRLVHQRMGKSTKYPHSKPRGFLCPGGQKSCQGQNSIPQCGVRTWL